MVAHRYDFVVDNREVPTTDPFSFTRSGERWISHEWGFGVLAFAVHALGEYRGLVVLKSLLAVGIATSLFKGLDWEEAAILGLMLLALLPCRREFYRRSSLLRESFTPGWMVAISAVLLATTWVAVFAHQHVEYSGQLWWRLLLYTTT